MNELLVNAAKRELLEEAGIKNIDLIQLAAFDAIGRDPRDRNIAVAFYGFTTPSNSAIKAGDDASDAQWFPINALPNLAFDHKVIIDMAIRTLEL
jgi:8-oxo-dGTP diphosphatase